MGSNTLQLTPRNHQRRCAAVRAEGEQLYLLGGRSSASRFVSVQLPDFDLGDEVYVGLFICSHTGDVAEKATFRDVRIIEPVKEGFVPYRDFIRELAGDFGSGLRPIASVEGIGGAV